MSHEFVSGVFGNQSPAWHGLGEVVPGLLTTEEALTRSGVRTIEAVPEPIYIRRGAEFIQVDPDEYTAVVNQNDNRILGIHSGDYRIENFVDAFRALGFAEDAKVWETMVLLRQGKIAAGVLRLPDLDKVLPDHSHLAAYVAAYTSHDGSYALTYKDTDIRIECANKLRLADSRDAGRSFRILHRPSKDEQKRHVAEIMTYAKERADAHERFAAEMLAKKLDERAAEAIVAALCPKPAEITTPGQKAANTRAEAKRDAILNAYRNSPDLQNCLGTGWAMVQAVGSYVDHAARFVPTKDATLGERRFIRTVLNTDTIAEKALELVRSA